MQCLVQQIQRPTNFSIKKKKENKKYNYGCNFPGHEIRER